MADLTIKINGDAVSYEDALESAKAKTQDLSDRFENLSKVAGAAFAAFTAEIGLSVKAFGESQQATNSLTQALQNQGIYSDELKDRYKKQGEELQKLTGIDNDKITSAQALLQGMIGNVEITDDLTKAILDLSAAKHMDLMASAELIGKGIEGHTAALLRDGIVVDASLDKQQRMAKIISEVSIQMGGQAEAANKGIGGLMGLHRAFDDIQKSIGELFEPTVSKVIKTMTSFFQIISDNKEFVQLTAIVLATGAAVSGLTLAVGLGGMAWVQYEAMMVAAGVASQAMSMTVATLAGATGIGLLAIALSEVYLHWNSIWPAMQATFKEFTYIVSEQVQGLGKIIQGALTLNPAKMKEGLDEIYALVGTNRKQFETMIDASHSKELSSETKQQADKLALFKAHNEQVVELEKLKNAAVNVEREILSAKLADDSAAYIKLKTDELDTLKALQEVKNAAIKQQLYDHLKEIQSVEELAHEESVQSVKDLNDRILASNDAYNQMDAEHKKLFIAQNQKLLVDSLNNKKSAQDKYALQDVQADIARRNAYLATEAKYGHDVAAIDSVVNDSHVNKLRDTNQSLVGMQNSHNATLKAIGKAAAITDITINSAQGAYKIMDGFISALGPLAGIPLGGIAAAAYVAYGVEQIANVVGAADGGLITGGVPGMDSVPAMLMPGELVVPKNNFEEVVNSVSDKRTGTSELSSGSGGGGVAEIVLTLKDDLMDFIEAKLVERTRFNMSIVGT